VKPMQKFGLSAALVGMTSMWMVACGYSEEEMQAQRDAILALQAELQESEERAASLDAHVQALSTKNSELMDRLNLAGAEKGSLSASLAEKERALEELRVRERQAQERLKTFQQMLDKFKAMIETGKLRVRVVRGRMVVELSENILFDSGKAALKKGGEEALTQVADVLKSMTDTKRQITDAQNFIVQKKSEQDDIRARSAVEVERLRKLLAEKAAGKR